MECAHLFCFLKSQKMRIQRDLNNRRDDFDGVYAHVEVHTKHFLLNMRSVSSQSSLRDSGFFSLDLNGGKKANASRQGHRPPNRFSAFCRRVTVLRHAAHTSSKHSNAWKLCVDAHYPTGPNKAKHFPTAVCPTSLAPCLSRRQVIENHDSTVIFFHWIYFHSNTLQGCIHLATVIWQILSCSIVGLVLRPSLVGHKLERFTVVPLVLFVVPESGGDSIKSLSCFSTIFLGSSTQITWSSRFIRSHFGSSHFLFERARCLSRARASLVLFCPSVFNPVL